MADCLTCASLDNFQNLRQLYETGLFSEISTKIRPVFKSLLITYIVVVGAKMLLTGDTSNAKKFILQFGILIVLVGSVFASSGEPVVSTYLINPIEGMALSLSGSFINKAVHLNGVSATVEVKKYSDLMGLVESQVMSLLDMFPQMIVANGAGYFSFRMLTNTVAACFLALPYLFIAALFFGFLVESGFYIFAMSAVSPIWMMALVFPSTREWAKKAVQLILCAGFTIIFLGVAFGFATTGITKFVNGLHASLSPNQSVDTSLQYLISNCQTGYADPKLDSEGNMIEIGGPIYSQSADCQAALQQSISSAQTNVKSGYVPWTGEYWSYIIFGIGVVILHLGAKTLASNISQVSSGPGAVGAVMAGAVATGAGAAMFAASAGNRAIFGQAGIGGRIDNFMQSHGVTGGAVGTVGNAATSLFNAVGGGSPSPSSPASTDANPFGGPNRPSAPMSMSMSQDMSKAFDGLSKSLEQIAKNTKPPGGSA